MISIEQIKDLREETGVSVSEVKKALTEANGDSTKAKELLRMWGKKVFDKKLSRETKSGLVESYVHKSGRTGVLLDIRCETDFVANSPEFRTLSHEICLQIVAMKPLFVSENEIPAELIEKETKIYTEQTKDAKKPEAIMKQILEGKLSKYKQEICLINQTWVKDETKTIKNLIEEVVSKVGENIEIKKFTRYEI